MPEISIIIPFYNRLNWTIESISSAINQIYKDIEIIVIDDGSEGDYEETIKRLDSRIKYLKQNRRGPSSARNLGIMNASGKFIAFLDSDDLFEPQKLETQIRIMKENPSILMTHTSYRKIDISGNNLDLVHSGLFSGDVYPGIYSHCPIATPTVVIRKDAFKNIVFDEGIHIAEDIILWGNIAKKSRILGIDEPLTKVRIHGVNAAEDPQKQIEGSRNIIAFMLFKDNSLSLMERNMIVSDHYLNSAFFSSKQAQRIRTLSYFVLSFLYWPVNLNIYIQLIKYVIPKSIRLKIKNIIFK